MLALIAIALGITLGSTLLKLAGVITTGWLLILSPVLALVVIAALLILMCFIMTYCIWLDPEYYKKFVEDIEESKLRIAKLKDEKEKAKQA